ncbi:hypothetical protein KJ903_00550 [Patescibacteria group bacterium]|nr:hypothetical protein [Patescibacteria group bacterium]
MTKFIGKVLFLFVLLLFLVAASGFWVKKNMENITLASLINVMWGKEKIELTTDEKETAKDKARQAKDRIYQEATEHNPEGDVLPDEIDDKIKEELKEEANKRIN